MQGALQRAALVSIYERLLATFAPLNQISQLIPRDSRKKTAPHTIAGHATGSVSSRQIPNPHFRRFWPFIKRLTPCRGRASHHREVINNLLSNHVGKEKTRPKSKPNLKQELKWRNCTGGTTPRAAPPTRHRSPHQQGSIPTPAQHRNPSSQGTHQVLGRFQPFSPTCLKVSVRSNADFHTAEPTGAGCRASAAARKKPPQGGDGAHLAWSRSAHNPDCDRNAQRAPSPPPHRLLLQKAGCKRCTGCWGHSACRPLRF